MAAIVLPCHPVSDRLSSASLSPLIRHRLPPSVLPTSISSQHFTSFHRLLLAPANSRTTFPVTSALASLSLGERYSEEEAFDEDSEFDLEEEDSDEDFYGEEEEPGPRLSSEQQEQASSLQRLSPVSPRLLNLSVKEKKELTAYAHSLGKKLKSQQVGKFGVTPSVAASFVENLESNELLKIKVHNNCPSEFEDAVKELEQATGSVAISQIGRTVILYRPSIKKVKKNETAQGARKGWKPRGRGPYAAAAPRSVRRPQLDRSRRRTRV